MLGEMIEFDEHIFDMGWFNHQLKPPTSNFYLDVMFPVGFWWIYPNAKLEFQECDLNGCPGMMMCRNILSPDVEGISSFFPTKIPSLKLT